MQAYTINMSHELNSKVWDMDASYKISLMIHTGLYWETASIIDSV